MMKRKANKRRLQKSLIFLAPLMLALAAPLWATTLNGDEVAQKTSKNKKEKPMTLTLSGLDGALKENVEARLSTISKSRYQNSLFFRRLVGDEIVLGLNALGYYEPEITFEFDEAKNTLIAKVEKGQPIIVAEIQVQVTTMAEVNSEMNRKLFQVLSNKGQILNQSHYDDFKNNLKTEALRQGYFDAIFDQSQLGISVPRHESYWKLDYQLKKRYQFGKVTFKNSQIKDEYLQNMLPFEYGEYYTAKQLALLNYNLSSTNWFESIDIIPQRNKLEHQDDGVLLPILVRVEPKKKNQFDLGLGYASDNGPRGSLRWTKPWINSRGHSLQGYAQVSRIEKEYSMNYKIPLKKSPLSDYYTIQAKHNKLDNNDTQSSSESFGILRTWERLPDWQYTLGINVLYDRFTQADDDYNTFLLYPSGSISRTSSDDHLFPLEGRSQSYSLELASKSILSDISLARIKTQQVWITTFKEKHRFVGRITAGAMNANQFERVPPSFRFFAGGERSIRGYSYQSVSPRDKNGQLMGASKLLTGTLEYNYNLTGDWWGAVFVDSGEAVDNFKDSDFKTGAGVGVRWISPVGPIKFDIATPVNSDQNSIHFYLGLGTDL